MNEIQLLKYPRILLIIEVPFVVRAREVKDDVFPSRGIGQVALERSGGSNDKVQMDIVCHLDTPLQKCVHGLQSTAQ